METRAWVVCEAIIECEQVCARLERTWEREGGWVEGGIIYVPAARWSWSPRPPATQLCCAASHQQFHQHQHQHQRQGIYAYTHVVQCQHRFVCLDNRAFVESGIICKNCHTRLLSLQQASQWGLSRSFAKEGVVILDLPICNRSAPEEVWLRSVARISCPPGPSPFATCQPMRIFRIFSHRNYCIGQFAAYFSCRSLTQQFFPDSLPGRLSVCSVCLATFVVVAWLTVVVGLK